MSEQEHDDRLGLVIDESVRALSLQSDQLDALHTRTGMVLSGAAITSSLFGAQVLREGELTCLSWAALGAFVLAAGACLYVLWPRDGWRFSNSVSTLVRVWIEEEDTSLDVMRREVADFNQGAWDDNRRRLGRMYHGFEVASAALAAEVVVWLIDLGTR